MVCNLQPSPSLVKLFDFFLDIYYGRELWSKKWTKPVLELWSNEWTKLVHYGRNKSPCQTWKGNSFFFFFLKIKKSYCFWLITQTQETTDWKSKLLILKKKPSKQMLFTRLFNRQVLEVQSIKENVNLDDVKAIINN